MVPLTQAAISLFGATLESPSTSASPSIADPFAATASGVLSSVTSSSLSTGSAAAPFAGLLTEAVGQVSQLEQQARTAVEGLMAGTGVDVHEAMIATEKAGMGFELMLSVRNKALAAYQQVMGMQF
jgi:flagellar hook-basal body complex protein FliE